MSDPIEALQQATAKDGDAAFRSRVERERRAQHTARVARRSLRVAVLAFGLGGLGLVALASKIPSTLLGVAGGFSMFTAMVAGTVLFFMGGIAPDHVRKHLSERERRLLDD